MNETRTLKRKIAEDKDLIAMLEHRVAIHEKELENNELSRESSTDLDDDTPGAVDGLADAGGQAGA